jgi:hypothetical protein
MKALMVMVTVMGCVAGSDPPGPAGIQTAFREGDDCQGRHVLGAAPDALTPVDASFVSYGTRSSNRPSVYVSVVGGNLVAKTVAGTLLYTGADPKFVGLRLATAGGAEVEITGVTARSYGTAYTLVHQPSGIDYCGGAGAAVALQGVIEADHFHVATTDVSLSCDDAVANKCEFWGYPAGNDPTSVLWKHHQACMRMANADVFGDGDVHTREETPIYIRDLIPGANPAPLDAPALSYPAMIPAPPGIPFFEAAWGGERNQGAICLAKHRWLSLPTDGPPHASLPDPRNVDNIPFCNQLTIQQMVDRGALLFNASQRMDMYLNRWRNPSTGDLVSTIRGYYNHDSSRSEPPFPGYTQFLGPDAVLLRNLTGALDDGDVTPMFVQHNPVTGDYVIATSTPVTPGHVIGDFEGYTLNTPAPSLVLLGLFSSGTDYVSSVGGPGTLGYTPVGPLHYIMSSDSALPPLSRAARHGALRTTTCNSPQ